MHAHFRAGPPACTRHVHAALSLSSRLMRSALVAPICPRMLTCFLYAFHRRSTWTMLRLRGAFKTWHAALFISREAVLQPPPPLPTLYTPHQQPIEVLQATQGRPRRGQAALVWGAWARSWLQLQGLASDPAASAVLHMTAASPLATPCCRLVDSCTPRRSWVETCALWRGALLARLGPRPTQAHYGAAASAPAASCATARLCCSRASCEIPGNTTM